MSGNCTKGICSAYNGLIKCEEYDSCHQEQAHKPAPTKEDRSDRTRCSSTAKRAKRVRDDRSQLAPAPSGEECDLEPLARQGQVGFEGLVDTARS